MKTTEPISKSVGDEVTNLTFLRKDQSLHTSAPTFAFNVKLFAAGLLLASAGSALADVRYVDVNSTNATPPYASWATAATNIQDAVDAAAAGDEIAVTNGINATGGRDGNRVAVDKALSLRSINGPQFTVINGGQSNRCVYLTNGASLSGFTLTNGFARFGGGAYGGTLTNCALTGNRALAVDWEFGGGGGGGAYGSLLNNCTLSSNSAASYPNHVAYGNGGGALNCTLNNCILRGNRAEGNHASFFYPGTGGGASGCTLNDCTLTGNSADESGGAVGGTLNNCTLTGNSGAGAAFSTLNNCILTSNSSGALAGTLNNCTLTGNSGGGAVTYRFHPVDGEDEEVPTTLNNCIIYFNGWNYDPETTLNYCCTTPLPTNGVGNITNAPLFVDQASGNLRLQSNSPCINAGLNAFAPAGPDLDGNPRIGGGTVDLGAYEFQLPVSQISYAWLQQFNLPINPSTDAADPDSDGVNNYREWFAGSDPTNPFSFPPLLTLIPYGANVILTWPTNAVGFTLQSTTNLDSAAVWDTNSPAPVVIGGQNVIINPLSGPRQFYRLTQ